MSDPLIPPFPDYADWARRTGLQSMFKELQRAEVEHRHFLNATTSSLKFAVDQATKAMQASLGHDLTLQLRDLTDQIHVHTRGSSALAEISNVDALRRIDELLGSFNRTQWSELAERLRQQEAGWYERFRSVVAPWRSVFDREVLDQVVQGVKDAPPSAISVEEVVADAVSKAIAVDRQRTDPRFVVQLILAILMFLAQWQPKDGSDLDIQEQFETIQTRLLAQELVQEALATRQVLRRTHLFAGPSRHRAVVMILPQGSSVVVRERRAKWTRVRVLALYDGDQRRAETGWVMNKYLERAP